jgi:hypothetical protein
VALDVAFLKGGQIVLQAEMDTLLEGARRVIAPSSVLQGVAILGGATYVVAGALGLFIWPLVALVFNLAAGHLAVARWRAMLAAPAAFPAGHRVA